MRNAAPAGRGAAAAARVVRAPAPDPGGAHRPREDQTDRRARADDDVSGQFDRPRGRTEGARRRHAKGVVETTEKQPKPTTTAAPTTTTTATATTAAAAQEAVPFAERAGQRQESVRIADAEAGDSAVGLRAAKEQRLGASAALGAQLSVEVRRIVARWRRHQKSTRFPPTFFSRFLYSITLPLPSDKTRKKKTLKSNLDSQRF